MDPGTPDPRGETYCSGGDGVQIDRDPTDPQRRNVMVEVMMVQMDRKGETRGVRVFADV